MVEHFHGKEGVSSSNLDDGSIFIMREEINPENIRHERRKGALFIFGSICSVSGGIATLSFIHNNNLDMLPATGLRLPAVISIVGGVLLASTGMSKLRPDDNGHDDGWNGGGGGWEPQPDKPAPSGDGLDFTPEDFMPDYIYHPNLHAVDNKQELQPV